MINIYNFCTSNLGDFLNGMPVVSGLGKAYGPVNLTIKSDMRKFKGIRDFLMFQGLFNDVLFDDGARDPNQLMLSSWTREDQNNPLRPSETCRYENWVRDKYPQIVFEVDDDFELKVDDLGIEVPEGYLVGNRTNHSPDPRRAVDHLGHLTNCTFLDYDRPVMENAYIIKNSKKPFITCFTGIGMLADLMYKDTLVVWKPEDFNEEFRRGDDVCWDGKNIQQVMQKHFYGDRNGKLIHDRDLTDYLANLPQ